MLSDSFHVFIHIFASIVAYISELDFLNFSSDKIKKYSAFINVGLFFVSAGVIFVEAVERVKHPLDLKIGWLFFAIAFLGLFANVYGAQLTNRIKDHQCSLNADTLHACMAYDAASSVIVILGVGVIFLTGFYIIDPILSFGLVVLMLWRGYRLSTKVLKLP
jgi:cobalt-zinc-cadmium efflux system protein